MVYSDHISKVEAVIDTDTGLVDLKIYDLEDELIFDDECKLSKASKDEPMIRFSIPNHPETDRKESFKAILESRGYRGWSMYIYPQFGKGTLGTGSQLVKKEGNDEFFKH